MAKGEISHVEFPADDPERAKRFYSAVAGWTYDDVGGGYWMFRNGPGSGGAIGKRGDAVGDKVRTYITVDSLETAVSAAETNGGATLTPPTDIPNMGRYAAIRDTEGNEVGLWELPRG